MAKGTVYAPTHRGPGDDRPVAQGSDLTVLNVIRQSKTEARQARWSRILKNRANLRMFLGEQDYSYKARGQSKEFLPKLPMAVEQFAAAIKRSLTDYGDWFRTEVPKVAPLTGENVRSMLTAYLDKLTSADGVPVPFSVVISDAMKLGALNSLVILKCHGGLVSEKRFVAERGLKYAEFGGQSFPQVTHTLKHQEVSNYRLWLDLIRDEDYYPDPRGHGLYEIHEIETDLAHLIDWADAGIYDKTAVDRIEEDFQNIEQEIIRIRYVGQDIAPVPSFRKRVILTEFWGTILNTNGRVVKKNCVTTVANDKYLIRPPEDNPNWHKESPFVVAPLVRVPHSVWHKALADHGTSLNIAINELFNLMVDGGLASVWGIKQLHTSWLEDPRQVSDGVPQGVTLQVNSECPPGAKVVEVVATGQVPQDALAMFNITDREFQAGMMVNDLKLGMLPPKQIKATEVVASEQGQASLLDGLVRDIEDMIIEPVLRKSWWNLLQYANDLDQDDVIGAIGTKAAVILTRMSPAERYAAFAGCKFRVYGLNAVRSHVRDFQKLAALLQIIQANPLMLQAFMKSYSLDATLAQILKTLNIDPAQLRLTPEEQQALPQTLQQLPFFSQMLGQTPQGQTQGGAGMSAQNTGEPGLPAEVNMQQTNALSQAGV